MTTGEWQTKGLEFQFKGHPIFYREEGEGKCLVLIHGFPTASWDWHRLWPELVTRFRVLAPDMLGYGFSAKPYPHSYSILEQADLYEAFLREKNVPRALILAHDYGDTVAQELLARQNEGTLGFEIEKVAFLNGGLFQGAYRPRLIQKLLMSPMGPFLSPFLSKRSLERTFRRIFGPDSQPDPAEMDEFWRLIAFNKGKRVIPGLIQYMRERAEHAERWTAALQEATIPLRLIDGGFDPISGARMADFYRQFIPNPDVVVLEGVGHYPQVEAPGLVLKHFLSFARQ